jgi:hypothetical protein
VFSLYQNGRREPVVQSAPLSENAYLLDDFSILERGEYRWSVTARALDRMGEVEQDGTAATSRFRIDLPEITVPAPGEKRVFYGR